MTDPTNIIPLIAGVIPEGECINKDVIEFLDELKADALKGEIQMLAATWVNGGGRAVTGWSAGTQRLKIIAGAAILQRDLIAAGDQEDAN
jgi:hypothetical protein